MLGASVQCSTVAVPPRGAYLFTLNFMRPWVSTSLQFCPAVLNIIAFLPGFYSSVLRIFQSPSKILIIFTRHHLIPRPEDEGDPSAVAARRNQTTAVILCGVLGALFDLEQERSGGGNVADPPALHPALVRLTAKALMYLVLAPPSDTMPSHTPLRRAAIDLIGRGFTLWEPHLEVSKVLLGLLDTSSEADR